MAEELGKCLGREILEMRRNTPPRNAVNTPLRKGQVEEGLTQRRRGAERRGKSRWILDTEDEADEESEDEDGGDAPKEPTDGRAGHTGGEKGDEKPNDEGGDEQDEIPKGRVGEVHVFIRVD
jgi:hypothetical protein